MKKWEIKKRKCENRVKKQVKRRIKKEKIGKIIEKGKQNEGNKRKRKIKQEKMKKY